MRPGTFDLLLIIIIFIGLQGWWLIPVLKKNIMLNKNEKEISEDIKQLERIYKK